FHPDRVASTVSWEPPSRFAFTDDRGKTAMLSITGKGRVDPTTDGGKLVVAVTLPERDPRAFGGLSGKVVDPSGRPIVGARVALILVEDQGGSGMSASDGHQAMTDAQGAFRLRSLPRLSPTGKPVTIKLAVTKEGYAGIDTRRIVFRPEGADA